MFKFSEDTNYMMPAHFGGYPGQPQAAAYHDVTSIGVNYETDTGMLAAFLPELLEMTQPVLAIQYSMCRRVDREQSGMPKIFADIEDHHQVGGRLLTNASYEGWNFLRMDFRQAKQMSPDELDLLNRHAGTVNAFGWRYIPNIGRSGAALSHATLFPQQFAYTAAWRGEGRIHWEALGPEEYQYYPITQALSQLPIKSYRDCLMTQGSLVLRNDLSRQLG